MNICTHTIFIALIFIFADMAFVYNTYSKTLKSDFYNSLDVGKKAIYDNIVQERTMIYIKSIFVAFLLSFIYFAIIPKGIFFKPLRMSKMSISAISIIIFYIVSYNFYILYPKSDYMMLHLDNEVQKLSWLKIYKDMQYNYHLSYVIGFIGVSILFIGLC